MWLNLAYLASLSNANRAAGPPQLRWWARIRAGLQRAQVVPNCSQCNCLPVNAWSLCHPSSSAWHGALCSFITEPPTPARTVASSKTSCSIQIHRPQTRLIGHVWSPIPISPGPSCTHRNEQTGRGSAYSWPLSVVAQTESKYPLQTGYRHQNFSITGALKRQSFL